MADSIQKQIMAYLVTQLATITVGNGYRTNVGSNVFQWKAVDWREEELPGVAVADLRDEITDWKMRGASPATDRGGVQRNMLRVEVALAVGIAADDQEAATVMDVVRDAVADVYDLVRKQHTWNGLAFTTNPVQHDLAISQEEKILCGAKVLLDIEFRTLAFKPDTSGV